jgi:predicted dehydrogenase
VKFKPRAIHCEKPMDLHWDGAVRMHGDCTKAGIQLTINHQRRFNKPFLKMKAMLTEGAVGKLLRVEGAWHNFQDSGTHWMDMLFNINGDEAATWVLGAVDVRNARKVFGAPQETHGMITWKFANGVRGTYHAGQDYKDLGCMIRAVGDAGILEVPENGPNWLKLLRYGGGGWENIDTEGEGIHDNLAIYRSIAELVDCLESKKVPALSSANAIRPMEVIFAAYESSLRRARVDLPLAPGPSALFKIAAEQGVQI